MKRRVEAGERRPANEPPPSGQKPQRGLSPKEIGAVADELVAYHSQFRDLFGRREQREWSEFSLRGQLSDLERKTVEPMVLQLKGADWAAVRAVQQFLGEGAWKDEAILERLQELVAEDLGEANASVLLDGSGFPKQARTRSGSRASTAATSARSPTVSTASSPPMPARRDMPSLTEGSTCPRRGSTTLTRACASATACPSS